MQSNTRYIRQAIGCPIEKVQGLNVLIVGCGAIGRQIAAQIGLLGVSSVTLVDPDIIEEHNCIPQMFPVDAIGKRKVDFLQEQLAGLCPELKVTVAPVYWNPKVGSEFDVVFPTVDKIEIREALFNYYADKCRGFFDIRVGGDSGVVLTALGTEEEKQWYRETLFKQGEGLRNGCAQPMTNYIANILAGLSIQNFANWVSERNVVEPMLCYSGVDCTITVPSFEGFK